MNKPNNYDQTTAAGEFTPVELGDHKLVIKQVKKMKSKTNKPMAVIYFDFAPGDKQAGYFAEAFKNDIRPDKKWSNQATHYLLTEDESGNCSRNFKGFTTSVEKSNPGFSIQWGDGFCECFKGKIVGGAFGPVKDYYDGRELNKRELRWFKSVDNIGDKIPEEITTKQWKEWQNSLPKTDANGFMNIAEGEDDELPFN